MQTEFGEKGDHKKAYIKQAAELAAQLINKSGDFKRK
jgi:hypothetical protein